MKLCFPVLSSRFSVDVCRHVCMLFTDQIFKNVQCYPRIKNSDEYLFQKERPRLSNTRRNNWLRFWDLHRKPKGTCLSYSAWLSYAFNTVIFGGTVIPRNHFFLFMWVATVFLICIEQLLQARKRELSSTNFTWVLSVPVSTFLMISIVSPRCSAN